MKKSLLIVALAAATLTSLSAKKNDTDERVLMTVAGKPVTVSEFEYLYNKNNTQQSQLLPLDEYLKMFEVYKRKVADAEANGIDTTSAFTQEFYGYRNELSRPYMTDSTVLNKLIKEAYGRMLEEVDVSHIMVRHGGSKAEDAQQRATLDSIRTAILGGADFAALADKYSIDPGVRRNHGHMGYITSGQYPYTFEIAAYETPVGKLSNIISTDYGFHIVKVNGRRPARGQVLVQHILKLFPRGKDVNSAPETKAAIDSIYQVLLSGASFDEVAKTESQDPGSARNGGRLPWFSTGRMVKEFEEVSFALADSTMSEPFATSYGWHIVKRLGHEPIGTLEANRDRIKGAMNADVRATMPEAARLEQLKKKFKSKLDNKGIERILAAVREHGSLDTTVITSLKSDKTPLIKVGKRVYTVGELISHINVKSPYKVEAAADVVKNTFNRNLDTYTRDAERETLPDRYPEYRNLINEYRDGMLLFEISNRNVWEKAAKDKEGLEAYFQSNRDKYRWEAPKYKGYIIFTPSDSLETEVKKYLADHPLSADSLVSGLRTAFAREVKVEKVIAAKGENATVDAAVFGGEKPAPVSRWTNYFSYLGDIIDQPQESADVRGQVTSDYQALLEEAWETELAEKYPIVINQKVLDSLLMRR